MHKMLLLFSHNLTEDQIKDARVSLIAEPVSLPFELKQLWQDIPPEETSIYQYLSPFRKWLKENATINDYVLIQGDFGAVYLMVNYSYSLSLIPIYSTTERKVVEIKMPDGTLKIEHIFKHMIFRRYEREVGDE